jgi:predicted RNase H-like HicB family nuclease
MIRRTKQLNIRVTPREKVALETAAHTHGFRGVGDYLRAVAISGKAPTQYVYTVKIHPGEADEGGFWAEVPALAGCNTQGETYEETLEHAKEAIEGYLRMLVKTGQPIPLEKQPKAPLTAAVKVAI